MKILRTLLVMGVALSLCSCYLNTSGHLFAQGGYEATYKSDVPGPVVYQKDSEYYIQMNRYKKPIITQYNGLKEQPARPDLIPTEETDLFKIDPAYAMYLTGQAVSPTAPTEISRVKDVDEADEIIFESKKLPIQKPYSITHKERWSSASAPFWYSIGALDWIAVDMPVTIVENTLAFYWILVDSGFFSALKDMNIHPR